MRRKSEKLGSKVDERVASSGNSIFSGFDAIVRKIDTEIETRLGDVTFSGRSDARRISYDHIFAIIVILTMYL